MRLTRVPGLQHCKLPATCKPANPVPKRASYQSLRRCHSTRGVRQLSQQLIEGDLPYRRCPGKILATLELSVAQLGVLHVGDGDVVRIVEIAIVTHHAPDDARPAGLRGFGDDALAAAAHDLAV